MLPQASQARKAIWEAINPHTGKRRIDEAFPPELRAGTRENEMFLRLRCGSTWQVVGSDNYNALVGSPPVGVVLSEWALADPAAWAYLRPILEENGGWALFISSPRGRNHLLRILEMAQAEPGWFGEVSPAEATGVFGPEQLTMIRREMIAENGPDDGVALFDQEYNASFSAPLIGAYYARLIEQAERDGRIRDDVPIEPDVPVQTAWDLGHSDDTTIWWFQVVGTEIRVLDCYSGHGYDVAHYCRIVDERAKERGWTYGAQARHWVPWDARPRTLASGGRSIMDQAWTEGLRMIVVPNLGLEDGIQAVRMTFPRLWFDKTRCAEGLEALRNYQRDWDDDRKVFKRTPAHNWASHFSDAMRYLALAWREQPPPAPGPGPDGMAGVTLDRLWKDRERAADRW